MKEVQRLKFESSVNSEGIETAIGEDLGISSLRVV